MKKNISNTCEVLKGVEANFVSLRGFATKQWPRIENKKPLPNEFAKDRFSKTPGMDLASDIQDQGFITEVIQHIYMNGVILESLSC